MGGASAARVGQALPVPHTLAGQVHQAHTERSGSCRSE